MRNRTFSPERQLRQWQAIAKRYQEKFNEAKQDHTSCCIRPTTARRTGTIEQMKAAEPCIAKGCDCDPFSMEEMYTDTRQQPVTKLQERLRLTLTLTLTQP